MCDIADECTENGEREFFDHLTGHCDSYCRYCNDEYDEKEDIDPKSGFRQMTVKSLRKYMDEDEQSYADHLEEIKRDYDPLEYLPGNGYWNDFE